MLSPSPTKEKKSINMKAAVASITPSAIPTFAPVDVDGFALVLEVVGEGITEAPVEVVDNGTPKFSVEAVDEDNAEDSVEVSRLLIADVGVDFVAVLLVTGMLVLLSSWAEARVAALYEEQSPSPTDAAICTSAGLQPDKRHGATADCIFA
jgi:hypothetical protein